MILAITSIAGPEARKAEYPTSRLSTGNPQDEYRKDLILVLFSHVRFGGSTYCMKPLQTTAPCAIGTAPSEEKNRLPAAPT
jgi:hypothetical protein